jgi:hypothetical protein
VTDRKDGHFLKHKGFCKMKEIILTQGKKTIVDDCDYDLVKKYNWHALKGRHTFYALTRIDGKYISMHRLILGLKDRLQWGDHKNGNGLINTRDNLRVSSPSQNAINRKHQWSKNKSSKFNGVTKRVRNKKQIWSATICKDGKHKFIGQFKDELSAALAYDRAALELHGEFANLNFSNG